VRLPGRRKERDEPAESSLDLLVVGLGNPGRQYEHTRHNVGHMVVDELARRYGATFKSKYSGRLTDIRVDGKRVALLAPETYMNDSGKSVAAAVQFYKVPLDALLVVHDEGDFDLGRIQARLGGGLAGHNGLRSISRHLGSQEFLRLRIGVGRPGRGDPRDLADYVLADFEPSDDAETIVTRAADAVETLVRDGLEATQQRFN
jgi:peptidyl-tRNA hydrolase, PTH1 family